MNHFNTKEFEQLHFDKIRHGLEIDNISSSFFFCYENKILFVKKSRKMYKIVASPSCGFAPLYRESCFDVIYFTPDITFVIKQFCYLVKELVK